MIFQTDAFLTLITSWLSHVLAGKSTADWRPPAELPPSAHLQPDWP